MALLILLTWPISVGLLWLILWASQLDCDAGARKAAYFWIGLPPTLLLLPFFLLQVFSPTAQFNAGSDLGMDLWSFWVDAWRPLWLGSGLVCLCYVAALVVLVARPQTRDLAFPAGLAATSCGLGWFILWHAIPTA